jgi:hypothetical protein
MSKTIFDPNSQDVIVGDLVWHLLYGPEWIGVLIKKVYEERGSSNLALVLMLPGLEHSLHFKRALTIRKVNDSMGYVSEHWLRKYDMSKFKKR